MATSSLVPTTLNDPESNVVAGTVTDVNNTITGADGNTVDSDINQWNGTLGTTSDFDFDITDAPGDYSSLNSVKLEVRARVTGAVSGDADSTSYVCTITGTNAPSDSVTWDHTDLGGGFADRSFTNSTVTPSSADISGWTVRILQNTFQQQKGPDDLNLEIDEIEVTLDYNAGGTTVSDSHTFTVNSDFTLTKQEKTTSESDTFDISTTTDLSNILTTSEAISYVAQLQESSTSSISFEEALSLIIQVAQQEQNDRIVPLSVNFNNSLDYILQNVLLGERSITINTLLDKIIQTNKETFVSETLAIQLDQSQTGSSAATVAGAIIFDTQLAYTVDNNKSTSGQLNVDAVLDTAEQVSKLLTESASFSFTLNFDFSHTGAAVLDNPVITADNYIFVDLTNIKLLEGGIKTGSITFTTQQGDTYTVGLIGQAAHELLVQLSQNQTANKVTSESEAINVILDQLQDSKLTKLAQFSASIELDYLPTETATLLKTALFAASLSQDQTSLKTTSNELIFDTLLDTQQLVELLGNVTIDISATLDFISNVQIDVDKAISFLTQVSLDFQGDTATLGSISFDINTLQTEQVKGILESTINIINNLDQTLQKELIAESTIQYLVQLSDTYTGATQGEVLGAISFIAEMNQVDTTQLTTAELITLFVTLADSYTNSKIAPTSISFNTSLEQLQTSTLDKILTIAFNTAFDFLRENTVTTSALATLAASVAMSLFGDTSGAVTGLITFATQLQQDNVGLMITSENISLNSLLSEDSIAAKVLLDNIGLTAQFDQDQTLDLIRKGFVTITNLLDQTQNVQIDFKPSVDFDLQLLETSSANKNTLATILLDFEAALASQPLTGVPAVINFAIQQDFSTEIRLTARGEVTFTQEMADSTVLQYLARQGITFGHLMGLAALSSADLVESISFGTVTDFQANGFVLEFSITLPSGRTLKIYFEDRITVIDEEDRTLIVYPDPIDKTVH